MGSSESSVNTGQQKRHREVHLGPANEDASINHSTHESIDVLLLVGASQ